MPTISFETASWARRVERALSRLPVLIPIIVILIGAALVLALRTEQQRSDRIATVAQRFQDKATTTGTLLEGIATAGNRHPHVKVTPVVSYELGLLLSRLSSTPGFEGALVTYRGQLVAGRLSRAQGRTSVSSPLVALRWRLVLSVPTRQLYLTIGSDWPTWVTLGIVVLFAGLLVVLIRAAEVRNRELERSQLELVRTNADLGAFAHAAAHDLRAPLRRIAAFLDLALKVELPDRTRTLIEKAMRQATRLDQLIEDLMNYARAGAALTFSTIRLTDALEDARQNVQAQIATSHAQLILHPLPTVCGNRAALSQVFQNLLSNAMKFHPPGRRPVVEVDAVTQGRWVIVRVRDNGIGIDQKYREKVFERFQRLNTQAQFEGTGLGLPAVRRIVERHGGKAWIETPASGEGTVVAFQLPKRRPR